MHKMNADCGLPGLRNIRLSKLLIASITALVISIGFSGCEEDYTPKPRGFQRIAFPERSYTDYSSECGFSMKIPVYATIEPDNHPQADKCWYNLTYTPFNATLHLSYKSYKDKEEMFKLTEDARTLVYKHTIKADEIYETQIGNKYLNGMLYELSGSTATNFQFYVMDSSHNYIRGALYFNTKTNIDSVAPVLAFVKEDIMTMLESLRWK
jgi:gliding motility-associated lipoprotein GldD